MCTGGTTGSPEGVLWRQADIFCRAMGGFEGRHAREHRRAAPRRAAASGTRRRRSCTPPRSGPCSRRSTPARRSCCTTTPRRSIARTILATIARERVNFMSIVGDAFARR
jgi:fatty-acyl-CoA synthase